MCRDDNTVRVAHEPVCLHQPTAQRTLLSGMAWFLAVKYCRLGWNDFSSFLYTIELDDKDGGGCTAHKSKRGGKGEPCRCCLSPRLLRRFPIARPCGLHRLKELCLAVGHGIPTCC